MPELPEVEAARRRIERGALNRTIEAVTYGDDITHMDLPDRAALDRFTGTQFSTATRHGKFIFAGTQGGPWMMIHLGMAGSIRVMDADEVDADYIRLTVAFEGGTRLTFRDPRKFGEIVVVEDVEDYVAERGLGPDALTIGDNAFADVIGGTRGAVKSALLAQSKLAGVGNLWADESLYRAGILPDARACDLEAGRIGKLHGVVGDTLKAVVDTDAVYSKLPADWLIHRRDEGADCGICDGAIAKTKVGGRTSYFCPDHQTGA
ncbi:formamidopyrimidine-DNA glycosylase [Palleronia salina]|uniref:Formamidopyrimidine-DNA glycosylase n=1 Tax=Palleronia salina TaxID=313368 RepID=A0A1M6F766_9RHOB|nr:DNA-formamidopyrimidine glycosylase family protein [Palleronia salina]SHI93535.1 formamidopyrimidine-DNA glycosylase [Palleronia salina]